MNTGHIQGRLTSKGRLSQPSLPGIATAGGGFQIGAAGAKRYGAGQSLAPQRGAISNMTGYQKRDQALRARREALARRTAGPNTTPEGI
jgi:hypothetical protein